MDSLTARASLAGAANVVLERMARTERKANPECMLEKVSLKQESKVGLVENVLLHSSVKSKVESRKSKFSRKGTKSSQSSDRSYCLHRRLYMCYREKRAVIFPRE